MEPSTLAISFINESAAIPIKLVATTNYAQFWTSLLISSAFIFFFFGNQIMIGLYRALVWIELKKMAMKTKTPILVVNHCITGLFGGQMINRTEASIFERALRMFKGKPFYMILNTPGGEIFGIQLISRLLKQYPGKKTAIVPYYAMSGGTVLSLSCDEIQMGNAACLGPVDPQLGMLWNYGSARGWREIVKQKGKKSDDTSIMMDYVGKQYAKTSHNQALQLLDSKVFTGDEKQKKSFAKRLTNGSIEHGFPLVLEELQTRGVNAKALPDNALGIICRILRRDKIGGIYFATP